MSYSIISLTDLVDAKGEDSVLFKIISILLHTLNNNA